MPKVSLLQEAFSGGEFSPMAQGRASSEKYKTGLNAALNYVPTLQGPLLRRPATKFVTTTQNPAQPPVLIPFVFSQTQAYMLEFGQQTINFYQNGAKLAVNSSVFNLAGSMQDGQHFFYATRPDYSSKPQELIIQSSVTLAALGVTTQFQVQTPYAWTDVAQIKFAQNADALYLTHPNYPTYKLERFNTYDWRMTQVYFQDGPYLNLNSYLKTGDSTAITLQPGGTGWSGVAGAATTIRTGPHTQIAALTGGPGGTLITVNTNSAHGYQNGQRLVFQNMSSVTAANSLSTYNLAAYSNMPLYRTIIVTGPTTFQVLGTIYGSSVTDNTHSGDVYPALFLSQADAGRVLGLQQGVFENAGQRIWGNITSWLGDCSNVGFTLDSSQNLFNTSVVEFWNLGVYGGAITNGGTISSPGGSLGSSSFPSNCCFHQNRLCLSGSPNFPEQVDGSTIGFFENFSPSTALGSTALQVTDSNAYQFTLNSTDVNPLKWMKSTAQGLVTASFANEWCITPSSQAASISSKNVNAQQTSFFGAADIDAVTVGNAVLYVQRAQRKLREMHYFFQLGTFRSSDLTEISEHITLPGLTKLCVQKEPQPLVWGIKSDGNLVSMTYNRDDFSINAGWARHQLGGRSDVSGSHPIVTSMAVIPDPGGTYDQVWMVAKRYLANGSTVYSIEYLTNFYNDLTAQEDAFQGDCGGTYYSAVPITKIVQSSVYTIVSAAPVGGWQASINGVQMKLVGINGLTRNVTDINGNVTTVSDFNEQNFYAQSSSASAFYLADSQGKYFNSGSSSPYVSGGSAATMATTISGLGWLVGETINVLADGGNHPAVTVTGSGLGAAATGIVTLNYPAAKAQFGYAFSSQGQLLRSNAGSAQGSAVGSTRRVNRAMAMLHNCGDWAWGMSFTNLIGVPLFQADVFQTDVAPPLFSGLIREGVEAPYDFDNMLCFQQNTMLPGMVQAIATFFEENDV